LMAFSIWPCRSDEPLVADWVLPIALVLDVLWPALTSLCGTDEVELLLDWLALAAFGFSELCAVASLCGNALVELELEAGGWLAWAAACEEASPIGG
jgi:hypothetical protein